MKTAGLKKIEQYCMGNTIEYQILITNVFYAAGLNLGDKHFVGFETIYFNYARARVDLEPGNLGFARARVDLELGNLGFARARVDLDPENLGFARARVDLDPENFGFPRARVDLDPENSRRFRTLAPSEQRTF